MYTPCLWDDISLASVFLKWSMEDDRKSREGRKKKGRKKERTDEPIGLLWDFSVLVLGPSVSPTQSSLMGSSQPQEDTELPSVPKSLPKHRSVLTVKNL